MMNDSKYRYILYVIVIVILSTIGIQTYWNYKNYLTSKQQLINDVQISLDNAVDAYYTNLAKRSTIGFSMESLDKEDFLENGKFDSILDAIDISRRNGFVGFDSIDPGLIKGVTVARGEKADSLLTSIQNSGKSFITKVPKSDDILSQELKENNPKEIKLLTSKVVISMSTDSLSLKGIDTLIQSELNRKQITIKYLVKYIDPGLSIAYYDSDNGYLNSIDSLRMNSYLQTSSKSSFLPKKSELILAFNNTSKDIFKRIISGLLISTVLVLAVICCLFYLLKIIKQQKQLAEVKNDLISNITHEFKTPIATIGVAIESIRDFKGIDDKNRINNYLNISSEQLGKLNTMVEKLLETATLVSESLQLNKETTNIVAVLKDLVDKHQMQTEAKIIHFSPSSQSVYANVDVFHFESAINNVLDNAIKYGGKNILVTEEQNSFAFTVSISDDGNTLTKTHKDNIFEKFYRVPKGNTHDVKGFGIGLYYTKKIIEKHGGMIYLDLNQNGTTFKITLPNE